MTAEAKNKNYFTHDTELAIIKYNINITLI